jgi:hypothetical protein
MNELEQAWAWLKIEVDWVIEISRCLTLLFWPIKDGECFKSHTHWWPEILPPRHIYGSGTRTQALIYVEKHMECKTSPTRGAAIVDS